MNSLTIIQRKLPSMTAVEKRIAHVILRDPAAASESAIAQLARAAGVSESSVVNFAAGLGFRGFKQMKLDIARHLHAFQGIAADQVLPDDTPVSAMRKLIDHALASFEGTLSTIGEELTRAAALLLNARRVALFAAGSAIPIAQDAHYRLTRLGFAASVESDPLMSCLSASQLAADCVAVGVSHKGRTASVLDALEIARERGARTIGVTSCEDSPLSAVCDVTLISVSGESDGQREAVVSRMTQLLIVDSLCAYIAAQRGEDAARHLAWERDLLERYRR